MTFKTKWSLSTIVLLIFSVNSFGQGKSPVADFKVVGYHFVWNRQPANVPNDSAYAYLDKITHLNIAFINPDSSGNFKIDSNISRLVTLAHAKNVKVLASIGGGGSHAYYGPLLDKENRSAFVGKLMAMAETYNMDGIDVDLEGDDIDNNYEKFVSELAGQLHNKKMLITAAIATAYKDKLSNKAIRHFDFVNIMSYDRRGPWRPNEPGEHSPFSMAVEDMDYWHNTRHVPKEKLVLGLPFYGYGFGPENMPAFEMTYKDIVAISPDELYDTLNLPGNFVMYFNNIATIKRKIKLALEQAGGVMIWHLSADATGDKSLLNVIDSAIHKF